MTRMLVKGLDWIVRKVTHGSHALRKQTILKIGLITVSLFLLVTVLAQYSWFTPYDPVYYRDAPRLEGPSIRHLMGTDQLHRDVFSRVISGGKASLIVAFGAVALSMSTCRYVRGGDRPNDLGGWVRLHSNILPRDSC
jgi:ABC-type dipeptide/oligopeptide/nickel transport system permease subunit